MNKFNNVLTCVVILLVFFTATGVAGNYLFVSSDDNNDSPVIQTVEALPLSISINSHSAFQIIFSCPGNIVDDILLAQSSSSLSIRD
jgi:hypothetical protein